MCSSSRLRVRAKAHTYTPLPLPRRIRGNGATPSKPATTSTAQALCSRLPSFVRDPGDYVRRQMGQLLIHLWETTPFRHQHPPPRHRLHIHRHLCGTGTAVEGISPRPEGKQKAAEPRWAPLQEHTTHRPQGEHLSLSTVFVLSYTEDKLARRKGSEQGVWVGKGFWEHASHNAPCWK